MNASFWFVLFDADPFKAKLWVLFSVGAGVLKFGLPLYFVIYRKRWRDEWVLVVLWLVAFTFDNISGLGFTTHGRQELTASVTEAANKRQDLANQLSATETKLKQIPEATRQLAPVAAELTAAEKVAGSCEARWRAARPECEKVFKLQTEKANAETRDRLEAEATDLRHKLGDAPAAREAEPHIAALRKGAAGVGINLTDNGASVIWNVLYLLLIELCPPALLTAVCRSPPAEAVALPRPAREAPKAAEPPRAVASLPAAGGVLELLRAAQVDADGWITSTQRAMATALHVSSAEVNRQIADLVTRGVVAKDAGRRGTRLKLLTPPLSVVSGHRGG